MAKSPSIPGTVQMFATSVFEMAKAHLRRVMKSPQLTTLNLRPGLRAAHHVLIMAIYNEATRIPFVLKYYRAMGFEHFIIIDNESTDGVQSILSAETDVSLFLARGAFRNARFGSDWTNALLSRYCAGKWILHVDADEFLVFPKADTKNIGYLTSYMAQHGQSSMQCLMVDMYSDKTITENVYGGGEDPLKICQYFDQDGYSTRFDPLFNTNWIKGGVRGRVYFHKNIWDGPALNKSPLVFWHRHYAFLRTAHLLWPMRLNGGRLARAGTLPNRVSGALLHFKFLADLPGKLSAETVRRQHTEEYNAYSSESGREDAGPAHMAANSTKYTSWRSLQGAGLMPEPKGDY